MKYPWYKITNYIDRKFMEDFNGNPDCKALPIGDWLKFEQKTKQNYPTLFFIKESFTKLEDIWEYPLNLIREPFYFYKCFFVYKTHILPCYLKKGKWHEYPERIFNALTFAIIDFVDSHQEDNYYFNHIKSNTTNQIDVNDPNLQTFQSILNIYNQIKVQLPDLQRKLDLLIDEEYKNYNSKNVLELLSEIDSNQHHQYYCKKILELENNISQLKKQILHDIIDVYEHLWS